MFLPWYSTNGGRTHSCASCPRREVSWTFEARGRDTTRAELAELTEASADPVPEYPQLLPPPDLPRPENIVRGRRWNDLALVETRFGTIPDGYHGYTMLFERRAEGWVFLWTVLGWIA
jgi:hypothetical protein